MGIGIRVTLAVVVALCCIGVGVPVRGQQSGSSAATPYTPSSGSPSAVAIRTNFLNQKKAELERQLREVQRCIDQATPNLRGPGGTVNRVPSTDLVNCTRALAIVQAKLVSLGREADHMAADAQALTIRLEAISQQNAAEQRINLSSGGKFTPVMKSKAR